MSERGQHRQPAARLGGDVGQHEELAPRVRPAGRLDERSGTARGSVEPVEPGERIRLQHAGEAVEVTLSVLSHTVPRELEECRWRVETAEGPVVAHVDPGPPGGRPALGKHRHRRIVGMYAGAGQYVGAV